jgi:phosphotransferase system enzyme I (PtsI)
MCGEMAGDEIAIPILLGLGLDEFSMSASSILKARSQIRGLNKSDMEKLAEQVLQFQTNDEVIETVKKVTSM